MNKYLLDFPFYTKDPDTKSALDSEILRLVHDYGTPFYLFHEKDFCENFQSLCDSFRAVYDNYIPSYSYKTNYTPYICNLVKQMGGYAEVVSDMEYTLAKRLGYPDSQIIYNGPCKGRCMEEHILNGGISNIDSEDEALRVVEISRIHSNKIIRVGIRVNMDIGAGYISRFGLEKDSESFRRTIDCLKACGNVVLSGVHCHISRARGLEAWQNRIDGLLDVISNYFDGVVDYVDVGSGMFGQMDPSLAIQFGDHVPTYDDYARVVAGTMAQFFSGSEKKPILFSEPGTTLISKFISLATRVDNIKSIRGKQFVTVDSCYYNAGEICKFKEVPYRVVHSAGSVNANYSLGITDIMGYTCLEQDCLYHDFKEPVSVSDILLFGNVGGYSIVSKPPFIQPDCQMLCYSQDGTIKVIKRAETFDDVFNTFITEKQ